MAICVMSFGRGPIHFPGPGGDIQLNANDGRLPVFDTMVSGNDTEAGFYHAGHGPTLSVADLDSGIFHVDHAFGVVDVLARFGVMNAAGQYPLACMSEAIFWPRNRLLALS